jgi:intracellular septation protein
MTERSTQDNPKQSSNGRRTLLDFGPLLLFFGTNYLYQDLMFSVKVLVVATVISLGLSWVYERRIPMMAAFGCGALVFFAGLTLYFDNELFIKVKPTVLTLIFAAAIAGGRFIGRNPLAALMGSQLRLDCAGWRKLSWLWVAMFVCSAIANEIAWRNLSTDAWVTFKVFGLTGISLVFVILTLPVIQKHQQQDH